jgi:hypothetical protein
MAADEQRGEGQSIWVLAAQEEGQHELQLYGGPKRLPVERLGEMLQEFTSAIGKALDRLQAVSSLFELSEISVKAQLMGETGLALVVGAKVGAEAAIELKFTKKAGAVVNSGP